MRVLLGRLINWLGWPGFVQPTDYNAKSAEVRVKVTTSRLYTVVSVNGIDVYFDRLTGEIDGTGAASRSYSRAGAAVRSVDLDAPPADVPAIPQSRTQ